MQADTKTLSIAYRRGASGMSTFHILFLVSNINIRSFRSDSLRNPSLNYTGVSPCSSWLGHS